MSNRIDFDHQASEFLEWKRSVPADVAQARLERELHDAFVAGQEHEDADLRAENERLRVTLADLGWTSSVSTPPKLACEALRTLEAALERRAEIQQRIASALPAIEATLRDIRGVVDDSDIAPIKRALATIREAIGQTEEQPCQRATKARIRTGLTGI